MKNIEFNNIIDEALRQWNDFKEDREEFSIEDFVEFAKEISIQIGNIE